MILCFDFDLIGCKDLANGSGGDEVRHFVSQGDKNTLPLPHAAPRGEGGCDTLQPDCEKKGLHLQCTPSATALSRWSVHLDRAAKRPPPTAARTARGNLRSVLLTSPRSVAPLSAKARTDTPSPTHTADETGRKHAPLRAFVGHFVRARHFLSPFAAHGRTIPRSPRRLQCFSSCPLPSAHHLFPPPAAAFPHASLPLRPNVRRFLSKPVHFLSITPHFLPKVHRFFRAPARRPVVAPRSTPMTTGTTTGSLLPHAAAVAPVAADKTTAANRASVGTIGAAPSRDSSSPSRLGGCCAPCPPLRRGNACSICRPTSACRWAYGAKRENPCGAATSSTSSPSCSSPRWVRSPSATARKRWA